MSGRGETFADQVEAIVERIKPILAGHDSAVQGAVLAELWSIWLAGHPREVREDLIELHLTFVRKLTEVNAKILRKGIDE